ncbi:hypothetical protein DXG01_007533 [Tephrocybe rancida]|nr:hypothetical protein DXG01_007533 [Tephrocybe rancida]
MSSKQSLAINLAALLDSKVTLALFTLGALLVVPVIYTLGFRTERDIDQAGYVAVTTWQFFRQRSDFMKSALRQSGKEIISFRVFHRTVVATRGSAARKAVVENKNLDFIDGYDLLLGGLADDLEATTLFQQDFSTLETTSSPVTLLLPWLPTRARKNEQMVNEKLRATLRTYVEKRKAATTPHPDAIDLLLSKDLTGERILDYQLFYIAISILDPCPSGIPPRMETEWKQKIAVEVNSIINKYASDSTELIHKVLASVPSLAWEEEMPMLDLVIRDSDLEADRGRLDAPSDLEILGKRISKGSFVIYRVGDAHMNPDIYTNPTKFDPDRFAPGREEDKKEPYAFLGWGAGRHACPGMKFAKLQLKIVVSLFLSAYQYDLVNNTGGTLETIPLPNYNELHGTQTSTSSAKTTVGAPGALQGKIKNVGEFASPSKERSQLTFTGDSDGTQDFIG